MITIEEVEKTLVQNGNSYSKQEMESILEFLKNWAKISLEDYFKRHGKGNNLHTSQHR
jgi:hypothetical protein